MSPNVVWIEIQPLVNVVYYLSKYGALSHCSWAQCWCNGEDHISSHCENVSEVNFVLLRLWFWQVGVLCHSLRQWSWTSAGKCWLPVQIQTMWFHTSHTAFHSTVSSCVQVLGCSWMDTLKLSALRALWVAILFWIIFIWQIPLSLTSREIFKADLPLIFTGKGLRD